MRTGEDDSTMTKRGNLYIHETGPKDVRVWQILNKQFRAVAHFRALDGQTREDAEKFCVEASKGGNQP